MEGIGGRIRAFIAHELLFEDDIDAIGDRTPLPGHVLDSLGMRQLVSYLEDEFGISIDATDVTTERFQTITRIERFVRDKVAEG